MPRASLQAAHAATLSRAIACALFLIATSASAVPQPVVLAPFTDTVTAATASGGPAQCRIRIAALTDMRPDPGVIGVYLRRGVMAPSDRQGWLTGIIRALSARGVTPVFDGGDDGATPKADVILEKAWVTNVLSDIAVSVVFRVDEAGRGGSTTQTRFRGTQQKMTYFSGGEEKIQHGVDSAIAQTLDAMATHFLARCAASSVPEGASSS